MANKIALGLVIGGAVSSTVGAAFKDVTGRIKRLEAEGNKARVLQRTIGDTIRLRDEWKKAHDSGSAGASKLLGRLNSNLDSLKKQGVEVGRLEKSYRAMGQAANKAELKAKGHQQLDAGKSGMKKAVGAAVVGIGALAVPTKVSADFGAIVRDIAIKAGIANKPQEKEMSQKIIATSRDTGMARNDVADVVNQLVGAGMELSKALEYAPVAAKFVVGQGSNGVDTAKMINALGQNAKITDPKQMQQALEAIAYQGQAGSFEAADMAKWFPELLANMGSLGITGMDAVTQLGAMLQVQMKSAGGADEAANNLKNWMGKIGSTDTVKAYEKAGNGAISEITGAASELENIPFVGPAIGAKLQRVMRGVDAAQAKVGQVVAVYGRATRAAAEVQERLGTLKEQAGNPQSTDIGRSRPATCRARQTPGARAATVGQRTNLLPSPERCPT